jgi:flap endonuclease-1
VGVDLGPLLVKRPVTLADYAGKTVAFDAWNILYQFLSNIRQPDGTPLMNAAGEVTSHLAGTLYRTANLVEAGIKPVFVFDGTPHPLKNETLAARSARREQAKGEMDAALAEGDGEVALSKAKQTSRLTVPMAEQAKDLLRLLGIPVVDAPSEGEAQASWMCKEGIVDAACSQDFDAILFGTPRLLRNLTATGRRKLPGKQVWVDVAPEEIDTMATLEAIGLDGPGLIDAAMLVGTDFNPGIKGIGPKKAVQLIRDNGGLEPLLERLRGNPGSATSAVERALLAQPEALMDRDAIRNIFQNPAHAEVELDFQGPDRAGIDAMMVHQFGFNKERVSGAIERFNAAKNSIMQKGLFDF